MKQRLLQILRCPVCKGKLILTVVSANGQEVERGSLRCQTCNRTYPVLRSVPRFVESDSYARSFGIQWNLFSQTQLDRMKRLRETSRETFLEKTGLDLNDFKGKLVLEAGCGMGRFIDVVSTEPTTEVVGIDLSSAIEAAFANVGTRQNVGIVQADIMNLPFANGIFDIVFSIGVLHHTPDPFLALARLLPFLKKGGEIAIWVYAKYKGALFSDLYRGFTARMPWSMLLGVTKLFLLTHDLDGKLPRKISAALQLLLPISQQRDREARLLDTFDWYSPRYQVKSTRDEVLSWFTQLHMENVRMLPTPIAVTARKGEMTLYDVSHLPSSQNS